MCAECGIQFYREQGPGPAPKYCSFQCRRAPYERRKRAERSSIGLGPGRKKHPRQACWQCGKLLTDKPAQNKYCSYECSIADRRKRAPRYTCEQCGKEFKPKVADRTTFCSRQCAFVYRAEHRRSADGYQDLPNSTKQAMRAHKRRRREQIKRTRVGPIRRSAIYERDGWTCQLCGQPVERKAQHPEPMSATLDHIIPLKLGGSHTSENLQLAHFACNSSKGARTERMV